MKKNRFAWTVILLVPVIAASCGRGRSEFNTEGWIDDNTYRVVQVGEPDAKLQTSEKRRESARQAAIMKAQRRIVEAFTKLYAAKDADDGQRGARWNDVTSPVRISAAGGVVVSAVYDDNDYCEILYELKRKNLRKKVVAGDW
jgi:hypothetical protein